MKLSFDEKERLEYLCWRRDVAVAQADEKRGDVIDWASLASRIEAHIAKYQGAANMSARVNRYRALMKTKLGESVGLGAERTAKDDQPEMMDAPGTIPEHIVNWEGFESGQIPLELSIDTINGDTINIGRENPKVIYIDFWATWCKPCVAEMPNLKAIYEKYRSHGLEVVGISGDRGSREFLEMFLARSGYTWPQHFDGNGSAVFTKMFQVTAWPTTFLIGKDGKLIAKNIRGKALEPAIRMALGLEP